MPSSDSITLHPGTLNLSNLPDEIIPYDWLNKGYNCAPFVVRVDKDSGKESGIQVKDFNSQNTVEGFKQELISKVQLCNYPIRVHTQKTFVRCQGMINIDVDVKGSKQGIESWKALKTVYALNDSTLVVQTGSGGRHHYYRIPEGGDAVVSTVNWSDKTTKQVFDGIDIRSGNTVLVAPMRTDGGSWGGYKVMSGTPPPISDLPALSPSLYAAMTPLKAYAKEFQTSLGDMLSHVSASEGSRNQTLYIEMCRLVGQGHSEDEIYATGHQLAARFTPPLDGSEVETTIASAWSSHADKPKERMLREIRRRYVQWTEDSKYYIIDLDLPAAISALEYQVFKRSKGDKLRLPAQDVYSQEDLDSMTSVARRKLVNMLDYAIDKSLIKQVYTVGYRPGAGKICPINAMDGLIHKPKEIPLMYNRYSSPVFNIGAVTYEESTTVLEDFLHVVKHICGDNQADADLFLDWCAYVVQNPRARVHYAPYFANVQGSGRGTVMKYIEQVLGKENCAQVNQADIGAKFNSITCMKRLVWVDEMYKYPPSAKAEQEFLAAFNSIVTEATTAIEEKGRTKHNIENFAVVILIGNFVTSINLKSTDRRIMPFVNFNDTFKPSKDVYARLGQRLTNAGFGVTEALDLQHFVGHLHNYLSKRNVRHVNAQGHAPKTSHIEQALETNKHPVSVVLDRDIANRRGVFISDVVSEAAILAHAAIFHNGLDAKLKHKLASMWATSLTPKDNQIMCRIQDPVTNHKRLVPHNGISLSDLDKFNGEPTIRLERAVIHHNPPALFSVRNHEKWRNATDAELLTEYIKIHGISQAAITMSIEEVKQFKDKLQTTVVDLHQRRG